MEFEIKLKGDYFLDGESFKNFSHSTEMQSALWDGLQTIRTRMKHGDITEEEYSFLEGLREEFYVPGMEWP